MPTTPWYADIVLPRLLAAGRATYGQAIRANLVEAGFGVMPRQGSRRVLGRLVELADDEHRA